MTGLLDGLRAWLGSFFGDGSDATVETTDSQDGDDGPRFEGSGPTVVHRDDRPLETPDTVSMNVERLDRESTADASDEGPPNRVDIPDAEGDSDAAEPESEVSIPDAEAGGNVDPSSATDPEQGDDAGASEGAGSDVDFVCSVCGTGVDDPERDCPLCRSSDVVPAGDAGDDAPSRGGRTEVSRADDEAVDRLRDVQGDGE